MSECKPNPLQNPLTHKFLITVVRKGMASRIVKASKKAGAQGGTILYGIGVGIHEHTSFWGIPVEPEKEVILTLVAEEYLESVLTAIVAEGKLDKPGHGIGLVIDTLKVAGIAHLMGANTDAAGKADNEGIEEMENHGMFDLIVTIVNKGHADIVVDASKRAGAEGGTILYGRGTGIHEQAKLFFIQIEPEKELVLTLIDRSKTEQVLRAITEAVELNKPNHGIAFVLPVVRTVGINHGKHPLLEERSGVEAGKGEA